MDLRDLAGGSECVELLERCADLMAQAAAVLAGHDLAEQLFGDPRGDEIPVWVEVVEFGERLLPLLVGEAFDAAEQPAAAGPFWVAGAAPPSA